MKLMYPNNKAQCQTLDSAPAGATCCIKSLDHELQSELRLMELGFKPGETVTVLQRAPLQGLLKVKIKETRFAICRRQARNIIIESQQTVAVAKPEATPIILQRLAV